MKTNLTIQSLCALLVFISASARTISAKAQDNKTEKMVELPGMGSLKSSEALEFALTIGNLDWVKIAVKGGADVNESLKGETSLTMATSLNCINNLAIVTYLLENGAQVSGRKGAAALDKAVETATFLSGSVIMSRIYDIKGNLSRNKISEEEATYKERYPEFVEIIKLLLNKGANVDGELDSKGEGYTPLMKAVALGDLGLVKILMQNGASTRIKPSKISGIKPLMLLATANIHCEQFEMNVIVDLYRALHKTKAPEKKAEASILDGIIDPAQLAIIYGSMNQTSTNEGQKIKDNQANWIDVFENYTEITKLLISKGVNVNEKHNGVSPLDQAKGYYNTPMINALVAAGAK